MCGFVGLAGGSSPQELVDAFRKAMGRIQHRGQESAGASWSDGIHVEGTKDMGLVNAIFTPDILKRIEADQAHMIIGHTRYSTAGSSKRKNAQPHWIHHLRGRVAIASNGDVPDLAQLKHAAQKVRGIVYHSDNDAEYILKEIEYFIERDRPDWRSDYVYGITEMMKTLRGTYSAGLITGTQLYIFRDPHQNRPLFIGKRGKLFVAASETTVFNVLDAEVEREVKGGEIIIVKPDGTRCSVQAVPPKKKAQCIFEKIYFAYPDSCVFGCETCDRFRRRLGAKMAQHEQDCFGDRYKADCVVSVPDSGNFFTETYALKRNLPFRILFVKEVYVVGRTFITPDQELRAQIADQKYTSLQSLAEGIELSDGTIIVEAVVSVVVGDDSIVRLTTMIILIRKVKNAGIQHIHVRISAPRIISPCYYGIDMKTYDELIGAQYTEEEIRQKLGVDSLLYLPLEKLDEVIREGGEDPEDYCRACFSGKYPI